MPLVVRPRTPGSPDLWIYGTVKGQRIRQSAGTRSRALAEERAASLEARLHREDLYGREAVATFEEAALSYMEETGQKRFMTPILRHFAGRPVVKITPQEIRDAALSLYPDAKPATRRRQAEVPIRAVLNHHAGTRPQRREDDARKRWLTPEEAERLIEASDRHTARMIVFLLSSGLRTGEMLTLDVDNLRPGTAQAWIDASKPGGGKTNSSRWALVEARGMAAAWPPAHSVGRLFLTPKRKPYVIREHGGGQIAAGFNKARDAAGLGADVTPHVLRHTWATWFYAATGAAIELESFGGWDTPKTARRYAKLGTADLPGELRRFGWDFEAARRKALGLAAVVEPEVTAVKERDHG